MHGNVYAFQTLRGGKKLRTPKVGRDRSSGLGSTRTTWGRKTKIQFKKNEPLQRKKSAQSRQREGKNARHPARPARSSSGLHEEREDTAIAATCRNGGGQAGGALKKCIISGKDPVQKEKSKCGEEKKRVIDPRAGNKLIHRKNVLEDRKKTGPSLMDSSK